MDDNSPQPIPETTYPGPTLTTAHIHQLFRLLELDCMLHEEGVMTFLDHESGCRIAVLLRGVDDDQERIMSMQLRTGFANSRVLEVGHVNAWNRKYRWCRAYLDGDGDASLEMDIPITADFPDLLRRQVEGYIDSVRCFDNAMRALVHFAPPPERGG